MDYKERAYVYYKTLYMDRNMYSIYPNYESLCEKRRFHATKRLLLLYVYMFIERSHKNDVRYDSKYTWRNALKSAIPSIPYLQYLIVYCGLHYFWKGWSNRVGESNKTFVLSHHRASRSAHGGSNSY